MSRVRRPKRAPVEEKHTPAADEYRKSYKGHEIIIPRDERRKRIFIDGRSVYYGLADDEYYLDVYAYDRAKSLEEVVKRYIDYKERTERREKKEK
jgi:hypothetical protein